MVYKYISIEPISEKNNVLLIFKTDVSPCEEMGVKTEMTRMACNTNMIGEMLCVFKSKTDLQVDSPGVVGKKLQVIHIWKRLQLLL